MQASHTHQIYKPSADGMDFLLMVEGRLQTYKKKKRAKPLCQKPRHFLLSRLCPRPKGTALDSTDLSDMPAEPEIPQ